MLPFYNEATKQYEEMPFSKLEETADKVKVRFLNGFERWVSASKMKELKQNEKLTLESYRREKYNLPKEEEKTEEDPEYKELVETINIDQVFLNRMLNQVFNRKKPRE